MAEKWWSLLGARNFFIARKNGSREEGIKDGDEIMSLTNLEVLSKQVVQSAGSARRPWDGFDHAEMHHWPTQNVEVLYDAASRILKERKSSKCTSDVAHRKLVKYVGEQVLLRELEKMQQHHADQLRALRNRIGMEIKRLAYPQNCLLSVSDITTQVPINTAASAAAAEGTPMQEHARV